MTATTQAFPAAGGSGSAQVTAGAQCGWTASSSASWLTVTPATAVGSATVSYTVAASPASTTRTATLTIGGQTLTITQAAVEAPLPPVIPPVDPAGGRRDPRQ